MDGNADLTNEPVLQRDDADGIATLTLDRPKSFNALSEALLDALQTELDAIAADESIRVVVLAAAGKAFCAGHDLKEMRANPLKTYYEDLFARCSRMMRTIVAMPQPVIARVHGIAAAAGCQLVATCDLALASTDAQFATNGISNGLFCSTPSVALSRNVSRKHAFEMLFTGDIVDAQNAYRMGLVNHVVSPGDLDRAVDYIAGRIVEKSRVTVASGKAMFYRQLGLDLGSAYEFAADNMACDMMTDDAGEGIDAFLEKRAPEWKHR